MSYDPAVTILRLYPINDYIPSQRHSDILVHCCSIYSNQEAESAWVPISQRTEKGTMVLMHSRILLRCTEK